MASLNMQRASDLLLGVSIFGEPIKSKIIDRANSAMEELCKLGTAAGKPMWHQHEDSYEVLDNTEYLKEFRRVDSTLMDIIRLAEVGELQALPSFDSCQNMNPMSTNQNLGQGLQIEATRAMQMLNLSPINVVELLMDVNQWSTTFHNIVSRATVLGSFSDGVEGTYDGKLHVMTAEFHLPSPVIPTRECCFARYCKKFPYDRWAIVDVSLEDFFPSPTSNLRKKPSGCVIVPREHATIQVIWVEHVEADHSQVNDLFKPLVTSVLIPQNGRTSFLKLADRMMRKFCANLSATTSNPWMRLAPSNSVDVRVMIDNNTNNPLGTSVVFSATIWFNINPNRLFNFLRHEKSRNVDSKDKTEIFYLQESYADSSVSYVIYAPLDESALAYLAKGSNPDNVIAYPSGFAIIPGGLDRNGYQSNGNESLLTVSFHILDKAITNVAGIPPESVQTIYGIITETVNAIKDALSYHTLHDNWAQDELKNGLTTKNFSV
ncbi:hypothetical protein TSUD_102260 [Trifolium subterraneum]|uniref:START domain-containing protein n=1 Tax=Trifolium subterraneum TaxID=3900 RepID=A0A2Z6N546_TRISU|nr:hypothetical protein TSUD_102260 [Trifolium subterraneum]